jgi:DNA-nicking Smr family endonuclease
MSRGGRKSDGGGRTISPEEAELWRHATRSLQRVKAKPRVMPHPKPAEDMLPRAVHGMQAAAVPGTKLAGTRSTVRAGHPGPTQAETPRAPIAQFEPRKAKRIAAGKIGIDARIDLHGLRQADARSRLRAFLSRAHADEHKTVLVITGKGGEEPADRLDELAGGWQRGVLRRNVPGWLEEPDLRAIVLSYTEAGIRHGGAGALYVQLRKGR